MASYRAKKQIYHMILWAKIRAKERGLAFDIGTRDIVIPDICPVLGIKIYPGTRKDKDHSPTLDRVIPELGYVVGNVRVISHRANRIKSDSTVEELRKVLEYVEREIGVSALERMIH